MSSFDVLTYFSLTAFQTCLCPKAFHALQNKIELFIIHHFASLYWHHLHRQIFLSTRMTRGKKLSLRFEVCFSWRPPLFIYESSRVIIYCMNSWLWHKGHIKGQRSGSLQIHVKWAEGGYFVQIWFPISQRFTFYAQVCFNNSLKLIYVQIFIKH